MNISTRMYIAVSMNSLTCDHSACDSDQQIATSLNNRSWANAGMDVLQAYYKNVSGVYSTDFPDEPLEYYNFTDVSFEPGMVYTDQARRVKVLNYNESVEIVFQGTNVLAHAMSHPMHLHGYSFYPTRFNFVDPPQVTTFAIPAKGWLAIRFTANNPGVWFWHCHFEKHQSWGMDSAFIVKNGGTPETSMSDPPSYMPECKVTLDSDVQDVDANDAVKQ